MKNHRLCRWILFYICSLGISDVATISRAADSANTENQRVLGIRISPPLPLLEASVERLGLFHVCSLGISDVDPIGRAADSANT